MTAGPPSPPRPPAMDGSWWLEASLFVLAVVVPALAYAFGGGR